MRRNITPTVEGGLLVAITVILGVVSFTVPIVGMFVEFFFAVPIAVLTVRRGAREGISAVLVSFILLSILISPIPAARLVLTCGMCGFTIGLGVRKNADAARIFLTTLSIASLAQILTLAMILALTDVNFIETQIDLLRESFSESFAMYESMGVDKARIAEAEGQVEPMLRTIAMIVPTLILFSALANAAAAWFTSKWIFPKLQLKMPTFPPFTEWRFPAIFFYMAVVSALGMYWSVTRGWTQIEEVSLNILIISMIVGLVQGLALLSALFEKWKVSKLLRRILYVLIFLNMFLAQLVAITGLIDMMIDYRKKIFDGK